MKFFDSLQISILIGLKKFCDELEKQNEAENLRQKCLENVADAGSRMCDVIVEAITSAYDHNNIPKCLADGIYDLVMSAMLDVAKKQKVLTEKQNQLIDIFFRNLNVPYSKFDFINASKSYGFLNERFEKSVGLQNGRLGEFWQQFFAVIRKEKKHIDALKVIIDCYSDIVINFALLNSSNSKLMVENIIKNFINNISRQFEVAYYNKTDFDFVGEKSYLDHKSDVACVANSIINASGDDKELDMNELLYTLFVSGLYNLVELSDQSTVKKSEMLDFLFNLCDIIEQDGYSFYKMVSDYSELKKFYDGFPSQFIDMICIMGDKANMNDEPMLVVKSFVNFMIGIEKKLACSYGNLGYGNKAEKYCSDILETVLNN